MISSMAPRPKETINLNSVLLTVVLALSAWTLKSVTEVKEEQAGMRAQVRSLERAVFTAKP